MPVQKIDWDAESLDSDLSLNAIRVKLGELDSSLKDVAFDGDYYSLTTKCRLASSSEAGLLSISDFNKLGTVAANANNYVHPKWGSTGNTQYPVFSHHVDEIAGISTFAKTGNISDLASSGNLATATRDGLMSKAAYTRLYTGIKDVALTASFSDLTFVTSAGHDISSLVNMETYVATTTHHGLMSNTDKVRLDALFAGGGEAFHPIGPGYNHIPVGGASGNILEYSADGTAKWSAERVYSEGDGIEVVNPISKNPRINVRFGTGETQVAKGNHTHSNYLNISSNTTHIHGFVLKNNYSIKAIDTGNTVHETVFLDTSNNFNVGSPVYNTLLRVGSANGAKVKHGNNVYDIYHSGNKQPVLWNEVGGKPTTYTPSSHTHDYASPSHSHSQFGYTSINGSYYTASLSGNTLTFNRV